MDLLGSDQYVCSMYACAELTATMFATMNNHCRHYHHHHHHHHHDDVPLTSTDQNFVLASSRTQCGGFPKFGVPLFRETTMYCNLPIYTLNNPYYIIPINPSSFHFLFHYPYITLWSFALNWSPPFAGRHQCFPWREKSSTDADRYC